MSTSITATTATTTAAWTTGSAAVGNGTSYVPASNVTTTSTTNATVLVLPQLTTPFVPPTQCTPVQSWTALTLELPYEETLNVTVTYSHTLLPVTDAQYSACQPSGWDRVESEYQFRYSKAVCPSGYNYNHLSDLFNYQSNTDAIPTTAICCPSGFTYDQFFTPVSAGSTSSGSCVKTTTRDEPTQTTAAATTTATGTGTAIAVSAETDSSGLAARNATESPSITAGPSVVTMLYAPWHITWEKRDASELSPSPPVVSVSRPVSTWEPGTEIDPSLRRKDINPNALDRGLGKIIGIVVGCVVAALIGICGVCLYFYMRSRRRAREAFEREEHQLQEQRLQRIGEYRRARSPTDDEPLPVYVKSREQDKATPLAAVPPYKERPSSDSSRGSRHSGQQELTTSTRNSRTGGSDDSDGQTLHDGHTTAQNDTHTSSDGNQRHE